jgi:hypothetical protein
MGAIALIIILLLAVLFTWIVMGLLAMVGITASPILVFVIVLIVIILIGRL